MTPFSHAAPVGLNPSGTRTLISRHSPLIINSHHLPIHKLIRILTPRTLILRLLLAVKAIKIYT